jgi:hypothetical protein
MANDEPGQRREGRVLNERSASATIIQGVAATGAAAYGIGHLAEGVAKLKDAFGGNGDASDSARLEKQSPSDESD